MESTDTLNVGDVGEWTHNGVTLVCAIVGKDGGEYTVETPHGTGIKTGFVHLARGWKALPPAEYGRRVAQLKNKQETTKDHMAHEVYECHKLDTQTQVFFYEQDFYVLSNFSSFQVMHEGTLHQTSEHAYHYAKFSTHVQWKDTEESCRAREKLLSDITYAKSAHEAFKLGQNKELRRKDWEDVKEGVMMEILWAKVHQHEYVRQKLLATGNRELIEDSWRDNVWGWGMDHKGRNLLGKMWMTVREAIRNGVDLYPQRPGVAFGRVKV